MPKHILISGALLVVFLGDVANLQATELSGQISISKKFLQQVDRIQKKEETAAERGYWNEPNGIIDIAPPALDVASDFGVILVKDGVDHDPEADPITSLDVRTGALDRNVVVIRPKSRIKFIMKSPYDHELFSPGKHDFKPQKQGSNSFRPIDFYSEGVFEVRCKLFPHFLGWIVVTPAYRVIEPQENGRFVVPDLEEGTYTLKVFFRGDWIHQQKIEVSGRKQAVAVKLESLGTPQDDTDGANADDVETDGTDD